MHSFFKKYLPFSKAQMQEFVNYRAHTIVWVLMEFMFLVLQYFIWKAIYDNSPNEIINGYSFLGMITYVLLVRVVSSLTFVMPSEYISDDIRSGAIAMNLIKPINYRTQLFFKSLGDIVNSIVFFVIPLVVTLIIVAFFVDLEVTLTLPVIVAFICSIVFAFTIRFFIGYIFGLIIFLTINSFGIFQLRRAIEGIFSGVIIPLHFFPEWLYQIALFLPFMQGLYVPVRIFMGNYETNTDILNALLFQLMWIGILYVIAIFFWKKAVHRLVVLGG